MPAGIGLLAFPVALGFVRGGMDGLVYVGGSLPDIGRMFFGGYLFLRFSSGLGDRLDHRIMAERRDADTADPYALDDHHQKHFVTGFFTLMAFGAGLFAFDVRLQLIASRGITPCCRSLRPGRRTWRSGDG